MDQQIEEYLNKLIEDILNSSHFAGFSEASKQELRQKVESYFYRVSLDAMIENLSDEQLQGMEKMDPNSPDTEEKLTVLSAQIPNFAETLQKALEDAAEEIKKTGQVPS